MLVLDSVLFGLLILLVLVCGITDLFYQKIWNVVTLPAVVLGLVLNLAAIFVDRHVGTHAFLSSLAALFVAFGIFFVIFLFGGFGGGDVKFIAAIGALDPFHAGAQWSLWMIFYSVMMGGLIAVIAMLMKGKLRKSFRNVFRAVFTLTMPGLEHEPLKPENSETIPFGLGIAFGTLWATFLFISGQLPQ